VSNRRRRVPRPGAARAGGVTLISGSGIVQSASPSRSHGPLPDPVPGRHLWVAIAVYRIADPGAPDQLLDLENLITVDVGCLHCEQGYAPHLRTQPCEGEPPR
jgi:hypothetical protein